MLISGSGKRDSNNNEPKREYSPWLGKRSGGPASGYQWNTLKRQEGGIKEVPNWAKRYYQWNSLKKRNSGGYQWDALKRSPGGGGYQWDSLKKRAGGGEYQWNNLKRSHEEGPKDDEKKSAPPQPNSGYSKKLYQWNNL